jgi:hypothetical protein
MEEAELGEGRAERNTASGAAAADSERGAHPHTSLDPGRSLRLRRRGYPAAAILPGQFDAASFLKGKEKEQLSMLAVRCSERGLLQSLPSLTPSEERTYTQT